MEAPSAKKTMSQRTGANYFDLIPDELLLKVVVSGRMSFRGQTGRAALRWLWSAPTTLRVLLDAILRRMFGRG